MQPPLLQARQNVCARFVEDADVVKLCSGQAFSELRLDGQGPIFVSGVDIEVAFYAIQLPDWLRPYFCLAPVAAWRLGVTVIDGVAVKVF